MIPRALHFTVSLGATCAFVLAVAMLAMGAHR